MGWFNDHRRVVPVALGVAMFAVVLAAALAPNGGAVPAQTSCQYGVCNSSEPAPIPLWVYIAIGLAILAAIIAAVAILMRRRRRPPVAAAQPWVPQGAEPPPPGDAGAAVGPEAAGLGAAAAVGGATAGGSTSYVETPQDVGVPPPAIGGAGAATAAGAGAGAGVAAASAEGGSDIDSLMAELDKISGEILKRGPGKKPAEAASAAEEGPTSPDG